MSAVDIRAFPRLHCKDILGKQDDTHRYAIREVSDMRSLRALAHPTRVKLYELVTREGTLTTTRASELTGESSASCSFHLRQLAKYGFIEEAPTGRGRERPWRRTSVANRFTGLRSDPDFAAAAESAGVIAIEHYLERLAEFLGSRDEHPPEWRDAALLHDALLYLTVDEVAELSQAVLELTRGYLDRTVDPQLRPKDSRPVGFLAAAFPLTPTPEGN